ncbi:GIY-YIG nuclease family protein [Galbibacter sp. PAP.153]|uniref:GIY-YIG nuclease family protein n=1 Tax=Galbibacter sp. PAP.153 TaxID=3104623 RepID=UPI0030081866
MFIKQVSQISELPTLPGVYFFYDRSGQLIYIGKSINIQKRVQQHFSGKDRKSQKLQFFTKRICYEGMGSELISLLYESHLIKEYHPIYNRSQRRKINQYGLFLHERSGYKALMIDKIKPETNAITVFSSLTEAKNTLFRITGKHKLCQKINGLYKTKNYCFQYQVKECYGACMSVEPVNSYNSRVEDFLKNANLEKLTKLVELQGRNDNETGLVYIENGAYKGFGFCPKGTPIDARLPYIKAYDDNRDIQRILQNYLQRVPL